ncbi:hypothetical protein BDP27DRAFT_1318904 [Rhodocollybia butyracea]|uniref:Uncharacterized protein n=1 Tax=Rhodocollybia butyracea TaxID=206335 RepID=A0A9P5PVV8_9AGAR|nr:hypothetical protein BDP27DRAFT_1318904 [Rhodocollybia butyracea]
MSKLNKQSCPERRQRRAPYLMDSTDTNAVAGPSTIPVASSSRPSSPTRNSVTPHSNADRISLFLPPPGPQLPPAYIQSTQDLLGQFHLREAYDRYVRPFLNSSEDPAPNDRNGTITTSLTTTGQNGLPGALDKGKGKEVAHVQTPAADGQDVDDDDGPGGKGEKKKKNSYKHLINGVPGALANFSLFCFVVDSIKQENIL